MTYDEVEVGQKVQINTAAPKYRAKGTVVSKHIQRIAGEKREVVIVDDTRGSRRVCAPRVLEALA